jgi:hypothetical protein
MPEAPLRDTTVPAPVLWSGPWLLCLFPDLVLCAWGSNFQCHGMDVGMWSMEWEWTAHWLPYEKSNSGFYKYFGQTRWTQAGCAILASRISFLFSMTTLRSFNKLNRRVFSICLWIDSIDECLLMMIFCNLVFQFSSLVGWALVSCGGMHAANTHLCQTNCAGMGGHSGSLPFHLSVKIQTVVLIRVCIFL